MKILLAGLYNAYGGSTFTLLQMKKALENNFEVVLRSPIKEADIHQNCAFPTYTLNSLLKKIGVLKIFICLFISEYKYLKNSEFNFIIVNDNLSLFLYGFIAKLLKKKLIFRVENHEGKGILKKIKDYLSYKKIYIAKFMIPKKEKNYFIIRNSLSIKKYPKIEHNTKNIFVVGSICKNKNQIFALNVFRKIIKFNPNYRLYFVGNILDDSYFKKLKNLIKEYNLEKYIFYEGFKSKEYIYSKADMILITSQFESFGLVFLEGLYNEIPIIAPNIDSFVELSKIIGYNFLYEKENIKSCVELFDEIKNKKIKYDEEIEKYFSLTKIKDDFYNFFKKID